MNCHLPSMEVLPSLAPMVRIWQVTVFFCATAVATLADEALAAFQWEPPKIRVSLFSNELGLLESEREDYATNLAIIASNHVAETTAAPAAVMAARRMIGLALQLSPRNKKAVVANFQLAKGFLPERTEGNYTPQTFARLLLTRGQLLEKQEGGENKKVARYFTQLAAELDPKNEDAVYASEVQRLDHGPLNWGIITDPEEKSPKH